MNDNEYDDINIINESIKINILVITRYLPENIIVNIKKRKICFVVYEVSERYDKKNIEKVYIQQDSWFTAFVILGTPKGVLLPSDIYDDPGSGQFYPSVCKIIEKYNFKVNRLKSSHSSFMYSTGLDIIYNAKTGLLYIFQKIKNGNKLKYLIIFLEDNQIFVCYENSSKKKYILIEPMFSTKFNKVLSCREIFISMLRKHLDV